MLGSLGHDNRIGVSVEIVTGPAEIGVSAGPMTTDRHAVRSRMSVSRDGKAPLGLVVGRLIDMVDKVGWF